MAIYKTPVLVSAQPASLIEVRNHANVAKNHACMTEKGILDVYSGHRLYVTIANFGKVEVNVREKQNVGEAVSVPDEIVHIKKDRFSYLSDAKGTKHDSRATIHTTAPLQID